MRGFAAVAAALLWLPELGSGGQFPVSPDAFTENRGQWNSEVLFVCQSDVVNTWFTGVGLVHSRRDGGGTIRVEWVGAEPADIVGYGVLPCLSHYISGMADKEQVSDVRSYGSIVYHELYPGIDLKFYFRDGDLEYDLILKPGTNPGVIRMRYSGAEDVTIASDGRLLVSRGSLGIAATPPYVYQVDGAGNSEVPGWFVLLPDGSVSFEVEASARTGAGLVIDPVLKFSTFLGGSQSDAGNALTIDNQGIVYVTGLTTSTDFPVPSAYDASHNRGRDVFVARFSSNGTILLSSTFIGGTQDDVGRGIALDPAGNIVVTGSTRSADFPHKFAYDSTHNGEEDAFVLKLTSIPLSTETPISLCFVLSRDRQP